MKPGEGSARWAGLEDLGDCFEQVLASLQPADIAACRLASRAWRRHVDFTLQQLRPSAGAQPSTVAATWRHLVRLQLAASARIGLPPLDALPGLRCLRSLVLHGPPGSTQLDCRSLAPLAAIPGLQSLEARGLLLRQATALQQLTQLGRLALQGCRLADWHGTLPALLLPLQRLSHLSFHAPRAAGSTEEPGLAGLSRLTSLVSLDFASEEAASDATCRDAARLPRLSSLAIARCASYGDAAPGISDAGLQALAASPAASQLTSLTLLGHRAITDAGLLAVAALSHLQQLELQLSQPSAPRLALPLVTDEGLRAVASLTALRCLHLGGACQLGERACSALAARLTALTSLQLSGVRSLGDTALCRLAPLAPRLRRLSLSNCEAVTDIGLAAVLKLAGRLDHLELAGCHRNITGIGLQVAGLRRLRHLNLAGCDAITDVEIEALLPAAASLEHLNLSDCAVSDRACALLAAHAPNLQWLSLEHCPRVSRQGVTHLIARLPLLRELHLVGTRVPAEAAPQLCTTPRGRRLHVATLKHCWWVQAAMADRLAGGAAAVVAAA